MSRLTTHLLVPAAVLLYPFLAASAQPEPAAGAQTLDDRLLLSANGSTLSGTNGGGGAAAAWLHELNANSLIGAGAEYQTIANAHWTFGSLSGALTGGGQPSERWSLSGEIHEGSGKSGPRGFDYSIVSAGFSHALTDALTLQLEERQIDVDTAHGSLPKVGLSVLWNRQWLATASYAHSVGGNLGTDVGAVRVDYYRQTWNLLAGGAVGSAVPIVVGLQGASLPQLGVKQIRELFFGLSKGYSRADWMVLADYQDVGGTKRVTLTLNCTVHLRASTPPR
jgi:hypothetical protein